MDELTQEQLAELRLTDIASEWLGESRFMALIIADIDEGLAILAGKRTTLEEKMIACELHALLAQYGRMLSILHLKLFESTLPAEAALVRLRSFNYDVRKCIDDLLKALRYNLSYVEQYFEFNFCNKLTEECRFPALAEEIVSLLEG